MSGSRDDQSLPVNESSLVNKPMVIAANISEIDNNNSNKNDNINNNNSNIYDSLANNEPHTSNNNNNNNKNNRNNNNNDNTNNNEDNSVFYHEGDAGSAAQIQSNINDSINNNNDNTINNNAIGQFDTINKNNDNTNSNNINNNDDNNSNNNNRDISEEADNNMGEAGSAAQLNLFQEDSQSKLWMNIAGSDIGAGSISTPGATPRRGRPRAPVFVSPRSHIATIQTPARKRKASSPGSKSPMSPSDIIVNSSIALFITRLSVLEDKYSRMELKNMNLAAENIVLRDKLQLLEGLVGVLGAKLESRAAPNKYNEILRTDLEKVSSRVDLLESCETGVDVGRVSKGIGPTTETQGNNMDVCNSNNLTNNIVGPSDEGIWHVMAKARSDAKRDGTKRLVASVVKEEIGRISRGQRVVVSGLAFGKDMQDEEVVRAFLKAHNVSTPFTVFKRVKDKLVPTVTRIIVLDVGSAEARDALFRAIKPKLRGGSIYVSEDKSADDLRLEFKLRQEVRDKMKNLSAEEVGKVRYAVKNKKVYNVGPTGFPSASSSTPSSSYPGLGLGLGLANNNNSL